MSIFNTALRMGLSIFLLIGLAGGATSASLGAALYEAQVPVVAEDAESRNKAIAAALGKVLVKLTGRSPAPEHTELAQQASSYVQQFRYQRGTEPEGASRLSLWVRFDKLGLDRAIRQLGMPLWGDNRPGVLVWLAAEAGGQRELISSDHALATALQHAADARGLPVQWPLFDLQDQARLTTADLWSDYADAITQASARYSLPLVLSGRLRQVAADHWEGRWTLYEAGSASALTSSGASGAAAAAAMIDQLTERLALRHAPTISQGDPEVVRVQIMGVHGVGNYAWVLKLFGDLEVVERVWLRRIQGDSLYLDVKARGDRASLARTLDMTYALQRMPDPEPQPVLPVAPPVPTPVSPAVPASEGGAPVIDGSVTTAPVAETTAPSAPAVPEPAPPQVDLIYRLAR